MRLLSLLFLFLLLGSFASGQRSIQFLENQFNKALQKAKKENKDVFVDTYAPWCVPCKKMDVIFRDKNLSTKYNDHFINVKINVDTPSGKLFSQKYSVVFLPTMFIIDKNGYVKHRIDGLKSADELMKIGEFVLKPKVYTAHQENTNKVSSNNKGNENVNAGDIRDEKVLYVLGAEEGEVEPKFLYEEALFRIRLMDGSHYQAAEKYLATQKNWSTAKNMKFILSFLHKVDSSMFEYFVKEKWAFQQMIGESEYNKTLEILIHKALYQQIPRPNKEKVKYLFEILHGEDHQDFVKDYFWEINRQKKNN